MRNTWLAALATIAAVVAVGLGIGLFIRFEVLDVDTVDSPDTLDERAEAAGITMTRSPVLKLGDGFGDTMLIRVDDPENGVTCYVTDGYNSGGVSCLITRGGRYGR
jgi:hypothetical protein